MTETFGAAVDYSKTTSEIILKVCPDCLEEHRADDNFAEPTVAEPPDYREKIEED